MFNAQGVTLDLIQRWSTALVAGHTLILRSFPGLWKLGYYFDMKGGKRPGAGRKKGFAAKNAEEARRLLSEMVLKEIGPIGEALIKKAKNGDTAAAKELLDRAFGKSTTVVEATVSQPNEEAERDRIAIRDMIRAVRARNKESALST